MAGTELFGASTRLGSRRGRDALPRDELTMTRGNSPRAAHDHADDLDRQPAPADHLKRLRTNDPMRLIRRWRSTRDPLPVLDLVSRARQPPSRHRAAPSDRRARMSRTAQRVAVAAAPVAARTKGRRLHRSVASGRVDAAGTYVLQVASLGLGFLSQLMVARLAGISGYGAYSYALAWSAMVVQPSVLGLDRIVIRELPVYRQTRAFGLMRGLLRRSYQVTAVGACALAMVVAAIALPVSSHALRASVALGLVTIPLAALGRVRLATLQGLKQASLGQLTQSVGRTIYFILFLGVATAVTRSTHMRPETAVGMQALAFGAALAAGTVAVRRVLPSSVMQSAPEYDGRRWAASVPGLALFTILTIASGQIAVIMLGAMGSPADTGRFNAAWRTAALVSLAMTAIGPVLAPRISAVFASGDKNELERILCRGSQAAFALGLPPALFLIFAGPWFLGLFGDDFRQGNAALAVLVLGQFFNVATGVTVNALLMTKHERSAVLATIAGTCFNVALCVLLIPIWGALGAAVATAASLAVTNTVLVAGVIRQLGVSPAPWLKPLTRCR
jgi:O-antigen/teichoic acid export membrane protein